MYVVRHVKRLTTNNNNNNARNDANEEWLGMCDEESEEEQRKSPTPRESTKQQFCTNLLLYMKQHNYWIVWCFFSLYFCSSTRSHRLRMNGCDERRDTTHLLTSQWEDAVDSVGFAASPYCSPQCAAHYPVTLALPRSFALVCMCALCVESTLSTSLHFMLATCTSHSTRTCHCRKLSTKLSRSCLFVCLFVWMKRATMSTKTTTTTTTAAWDVSD